MKKEKDLKKCKLKIIRFDYNEAVCLQLMI